jgi:hypothetical protein
LGVIFVGVKESPWQVSIRASNPPCVACLVALIPLAAVWWTNSDIKDAIPAEAASTASRPAQPMFPGTL